MATCDHMTSAYNGRTSPAEGPRDVFNAGDRPSLQQADGQTGSFVKTHRVSVLSPFHKHAAARVDNKLRSIYISVNGTKKRYSGVSLRSPTYTARR
jgi:hypothetical protein